jgi:hypothetical protein
MRFESRDPFTARGAARRFMEKRRSSSKKKQKKKAPTKPAKRAAKKGVTKSVKKSPKKAAAKKVAKKATRMPNARVATKAKSGKRPAFNDKTDSANDPNWVPPVWDDDILLGAHVSAAGGTHNAPPRARAIGATAMQLFTKMANRWAERSCEGDECSLFRTAVGETRLRATMAHDSYLINLASPDETLRRRSIESFVSELQRCSCLL